MPSKGPHPGALASMNINHGGLPGMQTPKPSMATPEPTYISVGDKCASDTIVSGTGADACMGPTAYAYGTGKSMCSYVHRDSCRTYACGGALVRS